MNIVFINFALNIRTIGALNVATYIRHHGFPNYFLYWPLAHGAHELSAQALSSVEETLRPIQPNIIAISITTAYFFVASQLTRHLKATFPDALMVWGGVHPTMAPDECLDHCDAACVGEGEEAFVEFLQKLRDGGEYFRTENFHVRVAGELYRNDLRPLCQDLDTRPFPVIDWQRTFLMLENRVVPLTRELFVAHSELSRRMYDIMASRGCPLSCTYCCNSALKKVYRGKGKVLRFRSVEHIMTESEYVKKNFPEAEMFNFQDDAFGAASKDYLLSFCEAFTKVAGKPFHIRIIPNMIEEATITLLKKAGLVSAVMGLQSSDRMNREVYRRPTNREQFIRVARTLHRHGISGRYDAIVNNPYGDERDELEVIETFLQVPKPYVLNIYPLAFFPFTELTDRAIADGTFNPAAAGYDQPYGDTKSLRYPYLVGLLAITPYNPVFLIRFFLFLYRYPYARFLFHFYWYSFARVQIMLLEFFKARFGRMMFVKKLVFRLTRSRGREDAGQNP